MSTTIDPVVLQQLVAQAVRQLTKRRESTGRIGYFGRT